jgi:hypothetical protein
MHRAFIPFAVAVIFGAAACEQKSAPETDVPQPARSDAAEPSPRPATLGEGPAKPAAVFSLENDAATAYGENLLKNGDAEQADADRLPAGWTKPDGFLAPEYGSIAGEWDRDKPGAPDGGKRYFRLNLTIEQERKATAQKIALTGRDEEIDQGKIECEIGGWFGGFVEGSHSCFLQVDFLDAAGKKLGTLATDMPKPADLPKLAADSASMIERKAAGPVPPGTRALLARLIGINLTFKDDKDEGVVMADNLSVVLRKPSP